MLRNLFYIMFGSSLPEDKRDTGDPFCYKISRCFWDINFPGPSDYCHTLEHPASSLLVLVHMQNLAVEPRKELGLNFCSFFFIYQSDSRDQLENSERPGVVISNHISYLDILYHMSTSFPSFVAKVCHLHYLKNSHWHVSCNFTDMIYQHSLLKRSVGKLPLVGLIRLAKHLFRYWIWEISVIERFILCMCYINCILASDFIQ